MVGARSGNGKIGPERGALETPGRAPKKNQEIIHCIVFIYSCIHFHFLTNGLESKNNCALLNIDGALNHTEQNHSFLIHHL